MKRCLTSGLFALLFICAYHLAPAYGPKDNPRQINRAIPLKFNLQPGDQYLFSSVANQNIVQEVMGNKMTTVQDINTDYIYDIQSVENGLITIKVTFDKIKMDTDVGGMQRLTFDSENPEAGTNELKSIASIVGQSFTMEVTEEGKVQRIEGLAEIVGEIDGPQGDFLKQSFGDSTMMQNMSQLTNIYPGKPVDVGDQWTKTFAGPMAGMMQMDMSADYTLAGIEGQNAKVGMEGTMQLSKLTGASSNPMLQGAEFNLKGTQTGSLLIAIDSGLPVKSEMEQLISGDIEVQGMNIPMTIESVITITAKKL